MRVAAELQPGHRHAFADFLAADQPWRDQAACAGMDPDIFFPPPGRGSKAHVEEAKKVCATCPVVRECLEYAAETADDWSISGGMTPAERKRAGYRKRYVQHGVEPCGTNAARKRHYRNRESCYTCEVGL